MKKSKMESFVAVDNGKKAVNCCYKALHLRHLWGSWPHLCCHIPLAKSLGETLFLKLLLLTLKMVRSEDVNAWE